MLTPTVFARGMTISAAANPELDNAVRPYWTECGRALKKFNEFVARDTRVDVTILPLFDGVSMIKWKLDGGQGRVENDAIGAGGVNDGHA